MEKFEYRYKKIYFLILVEPYDGMKHSNHEAKAGDKYFTTKFFSAQGPFQFSGVLTDSIWLDPDRDRLFQMVCDASIQAYERFTQKKG